LYPEPCALNLQLSAFNLIAYCPCKNKKMILLPIPNPHSEIPNRKTFHHYFPETGKLFFPELLLEFLPQIFTP
jgi:hypothetical protein